MKPDRALQSLIIGGLLIGGWLYGNYWKRASQPERSSTDETVLRAENVELALALEETKAELEQIRSMLTKGGYPVPSELISWVETDYRMSFTSPPKVRYASPAGLRNAVEQNLNFSLGHERLQKEELAWELLGLLPRGTSLKASLMAAKTTGVQAVFDFVREEILLAESFDPLSDTHASVLVRSLGLALSFQNHGRKDFQSRDEWTAWQAIHLGAATSMQDRYFRRKTAQSEEDWIDPEIGREELLARMPAAIQGYENFPFIEGKEYATQKYLVSKAAWHQMFIEPPSVTAEFFSPGEEPSKPAPTAPTNQLGALGLKLWLEPFLGPLPAREMAKNWVADEWSLAEENRSVSLTWEVTLSSSEMAQTLAKEIRSSVLESYQSLQINRLMTVNSEGPKVIIKNEALSK